jgi:hypothetical protein
MATLCIRISDEQMAIAKEIARYKSLVENKSVSVSTLVRSALDFFVNEKSLKLAELDAIALMNDKSTTNPHVVK